MNTLAHLSLATPDPHLMLGQFLGDHVKGAVGNTPYSPQVQQGIRDHRRIDAVSDQHEFTRMAKSLLPREQRRFAGIVLDLYCDALLAMTWDEVMDTPYSEFLKQAKQVLRHPPEPMPASAERYADRVLRFHLLEAYADVNELPGILDRMGAHLRRPIRLSPLLEVLRAKEAGFVSMFPSYFEEMRALLTE